MVENTKEIVYADLYSEGEKDIFRVLIEDSEFRLCINEDCRDDIKDMFSSLLKLVFKNDVTVKLRIDDNYKSQLMRETISEYVSLLNGEIRTIRAEIKADDSLATLEDSK